MSEGRVLVVDDERQIRGLLAEALTEDGCEVRVAETGQHALAILRVWRPDVIVLDLMMPVMDAATFRERQRKLDGLADTPVLVLSAASDAAEQSSRLGAQALVHKPFDLPILLATVARLMHGTLSSGSE